MRAGAVNTWFYLCFSQIRYLYSDQIRTLTLYQNKRPCFMPEIPILMMSYSFLPITEWTTWMAVLHPLRMFVPKGFLYS